MKLRKMAVWAAGWLAGMAGMAAGMAAASSAQAAEVCTAIADAATGKVLVQRGDCQRQVTPASTFKIPLSLMGYDAGFLRDEHTPSLPFKEGYLDWRPSWRQATDPALWMSESTVWFSQQLTSSLGKAKFAAYTRQFQYGNTDVSGDKEHDGLTESWLGSSLRISPLGQLSFLGKVVNRQLGVSEHAYAMTARLTHYGKAPDGWRVNGKTGMGSGYGWYVGWAAKGERTYVFARLVEKDDRQPRDTPLSILARDGFLAELPALAAGLPAAEAAHARIDAEVDRAMRPLLQKNDIAGMAVALSIDGRHYFYNYGVASRDTGQPVTDSTLFELGSVSKTFTATLATYAQANGQLAMTDKVSRHVPLLRGSYFDQVSLIHLGTHTPGDFPMQVPEHIKSMDQLMDYYRNWQPSHAPGTHRTYSNLGIGLLSIATANSMGMPYVEAMEKTLFPALGMEHSHIKVPADEMARYAQGYNGKNMPVRVNPDVLADEAYGVKSTTRDMIRFVDANMGLLALDGKLARAVADTHVAYFKAGPLTQDLIWEQYADGAGLAALLASTDPKVTAEPNAAMAIAPPLPPQADVWLHKTGATGGFSAYALYNPARKVGIVMLANRFFPGAQRVSSAYDLLNRLAPAGR